jgi:hypothetical protein
MHPSYLKTNRLDLPEVVALLSALVHVTNSPDPAEDFDGDALGGALDICR